MTGQVRLQVAAGGVRAARTGVLTACATALAVLAHMSVDGCVEVVGVLVTVVEVGVAAWMLVGRRRSGLAVLAWLAAVQGAAHLTLTGLCNDPVRAGAGGPHPELTTVLVMHAVAVLLTGLVLQRADAALWSAPALPVGWARRLRAGARLVGAAVLALPTCGLGRVPESPVPVSKDRRGRPPARRGPPVALQPAAG